MGRSAHMNQEALTVHHLHVGNVPTTDLLEDGMSETLLNVPTGTPGIKMGLEGREKKDALSVEDYTVGGVWQAAERVIDVQEGHIAVNCTTGLKHNQTRLE